VRIYIDCREFLHPEIYCSDPGLKGSKSIIEFIEGSKEISFALEFAPYQAYILTVKEKQDIEGFKMLSTIKKQKIDISDDWEFYPSGMNALRLGSWHLKVGGSSDGKLVECKPIVDQIHDAGIAIPIKLKDYFGCPKQLELPSIYCIYTTEFIVEEKVPLLLVMEPGSIEGEWYILLNGRRIDAAQFVQQCIYLPTNLAVAITPYVKKGHNKIEVRVNARTVHDGLINPLYLFGEFGVFKEGDRWKLCSVNATGRVGDLIKVGLPFYAGTIRYRKNIHLDDVVEKVEMYIDDAGVEDVVKLYFNGHYAGVRLWSPYRWIIHRDWIRPGENVVELHITNTLIRLFEGQYFDCRKHAYVDVD
jgi:hypothetical protein